MVDAIVSFAVERLGDLLIREVTSLQGVKDEVEWLKNELGRMQCFLKDAEEKQGGDNRQAIGKWIKDVKDVAYDAEDVIDTFILKVKVGGTTQETTPRRGFLASVKKCSCIFNNEIHKEIDVYNIGKEIEALKRRVVDIARRREAYGITKIRHVEEGTDGAIGSFKHVRRTTSYADEDCVIGFEDDTASLVDQLLQKNPQRCVISILGMGGLGKTTLARKLYHHNEVRGKFELRTWVCVSQEYRIRDLLQSILKSLKQRCGKVDLEKLEKMNEEDLERELRDFLEGRRYLVVIDDIWHREVWEILRRAFPDNNNGSRVIVTTRSKVIAERLDERTYVHKLRFLSVDESWELFCTKAFPNHTHASNGDTSHYPDPGLHMLGSEMVEKCHGLPLAIIVLGGLLSRKQPHEWQRVKAHIWQDLRNDSIHISQLLTLSFNDLPYQLKLCFLYLGIFPEDFEIKTDKLIRLWVTEGFIAPGEESLEDVAGNWLNELIDRSLIQVAKRSWTSTTACRVHDLLRDLAVEKAKELNFIHIYDGSVNSASSSRLARSYRRQIAHSTFERYVSVEYSNPFLRTLLFFNPNRALFKNKQPLTIIHTKFRLLRVLDLHSSGYFEVQRSLPETVGELIHLRYLGLGDTSIGELPSSIANLQALQTLDVFCEKIPVIMRLPKNIRKLKQLRHLIGFFQGPLRITHLTNLQTLKFVDIYEWITINPVNLINLRELRITTLSKRDFNPQKQSKTTLSEEEPKEFTWDPIASLTNLQSLSVDLPSPMYFPSIQPLSNCQHLLQLMIYGRVENLPEQMHEYLPNLKYLKLENSQLMQDPMPTLEKLPNLMILELASNDDLKKLICTANGFAQLEILTLDQFYYLEELEVEEEAMPMLRGLRVVCCDKFTVPERLRSFLDSSNSDRDFDWDWAKLPRFARMRI